MHIKYRLDGWLIAMLLINHISMNAQKPSSYDSSLMSMLHHTVPLIGVDSAIEKQKSGHPVYFLDTREKKEYKVSHIAGARHVGFTSFKMKTIKDIPKDAQIIVYCSLGLRSENIGEKLIDEGYQNIFNLNGGIFEWVYCNYPVVDNSGEKTLKVHTFDEEWSKWLLKGEKIY